MAVARLLLLGIGVAGVLVRPRRMPVWAIPAAAVAAGLVAGAVTLRDAGDAAHAMHEPLLFLALAVPMAVLLDDLGFFAAVADRIDHGRHLHLGLWVLAATVTVVFNLDAAVVLLTPLYIRIARRHGLDPLPLAIAPALLACLASSVLPVSNLTNMLVASQVGLDAGDFLTRLGPASLAAVGVGWFAYRRSLPEAEPVPTDDLPTDRRALVVGVPVVAGLLAGFTIGDHLGVSPVYVVLVADVLLVVLTRSIPWRSVPAGAAALVATLGTLVHSATPHLATADVLRGGRPLGEGRLLLVSAAGANALNNLPATLLALDPLRRVPDDRVWYVLLGVNIGPLFLVSGSLAGLLWLDTTRRLGVEATARTYSRIGVRVGLPALLAAGTVLWATLQVAG